MRWWVAERDWQSWTWATMPSVQWQCPASRTFWPARVPLSLKCWIWIIADLEWRERFAAHVISVCHLLTKYSTSFLNLFFEIAGLNGPNYLSSLSWFTWTLVWSFAYVTRNVRCSIDYCPVSYAVSSGLEGTWRATPPSPLHRRSQSFGVHIDVWAGQSVYGMLTLCF